MGNYPFFSHLRYFSGEQLNFCNISHAFHQPFTISSSSGGGNNLNYFCYNICFHIFLSFNKIILIFHPTAVHNLRKLRGRQQPERLQAQLVPGRRFRGVSVWQQATYSGGGGNLGLHYGQKQWKIVSNYFAHTSRKAREFTEKLLESNLRNPHGQK